MRPGTRPLGAQHRAQWPLLAQPGTAPPPTPGWRLLLVCVQDFPRLRRPALPPRHRQRPGFDRLLTRVKPQSPAGFGVPAQSLWIPVVPATREPQANLAPAAATPLPILSALKPAGPTRQVIR